MEGPGLRRASHGIVWRSGLWLCGNAGLSARGGSNRARSSPNPGPVTAPQMPRFTVISARYSRWGRVMAWREGRKKSGGFSLDLRLTPQDRTGGPPKGRADTGRPRRESSPAPKRKTSKGSKGRSGFRRIFYWGFVLALWGVIAGIGVLVWIGIHLPPIES